MNQSDLWSWREAESKRDSGISRSVDHADRKEPNWSDAALFMVRRYARMSGAPFMAEDARAFADKMGLNDPPDGRAWAGEHGDHMCRYLDGLRKICEPITVAGPPDVVSACQDLHELICEIAQGALNPESQK